jgi:hypothetical protein
MKLEDIIKGLVSLISIGLVFWLYMWAFFHVCNYFNLPWHILFAIIILIGIKKS